MPADLQKARELFLHAVGKLPPAQWDDYVAQACGGDVELEQQVKHFLQVHREAGSFLEQPAAKLAATGAIASPLTSSEAPGTVIGPYKLLQQIGEGGMGTVFMAEQMEPVRRKVALKVIKAGLDSRQVIARFEAERQALALMDHPNIAKVLDAGTISSEPRTLVSGPAQPLTDVRGSERPYFVMELVKGVPITKYCDEHHLTPKERLALFVPVCQAVQHAHQKGIIHRDLKASNVMVCLYDGKPVPKVIDFGVAKAAGPKLTDKTLFTEFGQVLGTLEYMSPEQAEMNQLDIDTRSDIYSLGVLLYELLTGTTPLERKRFKEVALLEVLRLIREEEPPRPSTRLSTTEELPSIAANRGLEPKKLSGLVRGELDWIVMKCLEKDRDRRYETANSLALDLEHYLADEPVQAGPPSTLYRLRKFARRHRGAILITVVVAAALMVLAGSIGWVIGDQAARQGEITRQVQESLNSARSLMGANQPILARQKLAEARGLIGNNREALAGLVAEVTAFEADLDRWRRFMDLVDQAHQAEIPNQAQQLEITIEEGQSPRVPIVQKYDPEKRQPALAVPFLLQALACYEVLEGEDWSTPLEHGLLRKDQVDEIRRTAYGELLWLATDLLGRREDHRSGKHLSAKTAGLRAIAYLQRAERTHTPTRGFYQLRADCHKATGQEEAARADQELAQKTPPTMAFDYYQRGQAAYDARNQAEGLKAFEAGLRLEPTHFWSMMKLGYCLCDLGQGPEDFRAAVVAFSGCIMKRPDYAHAHGYRGIANQHLGRFEEALDDYSKAIELDPKNLHAWINRGNTYYNLGQSDKALADFSKVIELEPKYTEAWYNRGVAYGELRQSDKAFANYSKAIELYSKAIELEPKDARAWNNRGLIYAKLWQWDKALANHSKAIELGPEKARRWTNRGIDYGKLGQSDKALADFSMAIELEPKYTEAWGERGNVYKALRQWDKAITYYSKAIELEPKNAYWLNELAWLLATRADPQFRDPRRTVELAKKAVAQAPQAWRNWNTLGVAHYRVGDWQAALGALEESIKCHKEPDGWNWSFMAMAYWQLGQKDEARKVYGRAAQWAETYAFNNDLLRGFQMEAAALLSLPTPSSAAVSLVRQGRTYARSAQWRQAAACYAKVGASPAADQGSVCVEQACLLLLTGDQDAYRRTCTRLLEAYGGMQKPRGYLVARACTLAPQSMDNLSRAEKAAVPDLKGNQIDRVLTDSAGLHYRAGRYPQAAALLHQCLKDNPTSDDKVYAWLWLALTEHQLGKETSARQWLAKATQWLDKYSKGMPSQSMGINLHLHEWLGAQVLRREAETLIAGKKGGQKN